MTLPIPAIIHKRFSLWSGVLSTKYVCSRAIQEFASGKYPDTGGDTVTAPAAAGYVSLLPSACLVEPAAGRGKNYSKGVLASTSAVTASGKIPDMTGVDVHIYIGTRFTSDYSATGQDTDGMVGRIRCFGYATEEQAKAISKRS